MPVQQTTLLFNVATPGISRRDLRAFAKRLETEVAGGRSFTCLVTSDDELRRLNREFRKKDYATDVLSFPSGLDDFLGEIAISADRAKQQATGFNHTQADEVRILMLHGMLHLLGMDHETDRGEMSRAERKWRTVFGLPPSLTERVLWGRLSACSRVSARRGAPR
jgi:probable rRNA maturation factor